MLNLANNPATLAILSPAGSICLTMPARLAMKSLPTSTDTSPTFSNSRARPAYSTARSESLSFCPPPSRALPIWAKSDVRPATMDVDAPIAEDKLSIFFLRSAAAPPEISRIFFVLTNCLSKLSNDCIIKRNAMPIGAVIPTII